MEFTNSLTYITLLLTLILTIIAEISAKPSASRLDANYYSNYPTSNNRNPRPPSRLDSTIGNIKRGYYYIDNGHLIPVSRKDALAATAGKRRQDSLGNTVAASNLPAGVKYTPLVRVRQTKTKRKKLFVPNFFG